MSIKSRSSKASRLEVGSLAEKEPYQDNYDESLTYGGVDMAELDQSDVIMQRKMKLINDALDEIGFTWYHFKLFCLNGMGYVIYYKIRPSTSY